MKEEIAKEIESAKNRYRVFEQKQKEWLKELDVPDFDGDIENDDDWAELLDLIRSGEADLSAAEDRDGLYIDDVLSCNASLILALRKIRPDGPITEQNADLYLEEVRETATAIKAKRTEDIRKAKEVIREMDKIIAACECFL